MKKKVLLSSLVTIVLCLCLIAGSTFALFTSTSKVNIAVASGKVTMTASLDELTLYSAKGDTAGELVDENGNTYSYEEKDEKFTNGGTAVINAGTLTMKLVTPGDKVSFQVLGENTSNVAIQYRYIIECTKGWDLAQGMIVTVNEAGLAEAITTEALNTYTSAWTFLAVDDDINPVTIDIELPISAGNEYQELETEYKVTVEAVQSNAVVDDNTDPVITTCNAATTEEALEEAINNATGNHVIYVDTDITGDIVVPQSPDTTITLKGNGHNFDGVLLVDGKSGTITSAGLVIENFVFSADSVSADACIQLGNGTNATRYTCNVTVANCTFDVPDVVGIKSYTGGDKNLTIINCTATERAHSLAQLKGIECVTVTGCTVNSVRGINFNNSLDVTVTNSTFNVQKYAVRFGESVNATVENYAINNCSLTSLCMDGDAVIVLRAGAVNANLDLTGTTVSGPVEIQGAESANVTR